MIKKLQKANQAWTFFQVSKVLVTDYLVPPEPMMYTSFDQQCGFTERIFPCRKYLHEHFADHVANLPQQTENIEWDHYYEGFGNDRVEFTSFYETPKWLSCYARTYICCDREGLYDFSLSTNGGVRLFLSHTDASKEVESYDFLSYQRNQTKQFTFQLYLQKGINSVIIYFDDLAERDTVYFFSLQSRQDVTLALESDLQQGEYEQIISCLDNSHFSASVILKNPFVLDFSQPLPLDGRCEIFWRGDSIDRYQSKTAMAFKQGETALRLGKVEDFAATYLNLEATYYFKNWSTVKKYAIEVYPQSFFQSFAQGDDIEERKKSHIKLIAAAGDKNSFQLPALIETNATSEQMQDILDYEISRISLRKDCSDFYLIPLILVYFRYPDHPIIQKNKQRLESLFFDFRFWYTEPGNDVMWFFSENHALLFHVAAYLLGRMFPDQLFTNGQVKGVEHQLRGEIFIKKWLEDFIAGGLTEWNSTSYIPIDLIGFFALTWEISDPEMQKLAKQALDEIFLTIGRFSFKGIMVGATQGRTYEHALLGLWTDSLSSINWVASGHGILNAQAKGNIFFSLSSYVPPESYYETLLADLDFKVKQGLHQEVYTQIQKNKHWAVSYVEDYHVGQLGYQEHVWGLTLNEGALFWINHPGALDQLGMNRPSYWGGNGTIPNIIRQKNSYTLHFNLAQEFPDFTHAYAREEDYDQVEWQDNILLLVKGKAIVAVTCDQEITQAKTGFYQGCEWIAQGRDVTWFVVLKEWENQSSMEEAKIECKKWTNQKL